MAIYIYNSLTRKKEEFVPLKPGQVSMYVCGPTVYDEPHIGHARSAYIFDVIRRYFDFRGYKVQFVRNVTDVDDKIIDKAKKEYPDEGLNTSFKKVATKYLDAYHDALKILGIDTDSGIKEPKASEYIDKMVDFIKVLIEKGIAYEAGGDVYFDITRAKDYGKLSHQALDKMEAGARVAPGESKRNPLDFALWKKAKENEPSWPSPWGEGRPGWHIECSVMSSGLLGDEFDIHGGGLDLIFPHHENEIAQSEGAGKKFAHVWIHHGLLTINGQKMAKSLGNFVTVKDAISRYSADDLKIFFLSAHYSSPIDFTEQEIIESHKGAQRIERLLQKMMEINYPSNYAESTKVDFIEKHKDSFIAAMDDNFNTPKALSTLFDLVNDMNKFIDTNDRSDKYFTTLNQAASVIDELGRGIFGLSLSSIVEDGGDLDDVHLVNEYIATRAKKDYKHADEIREQLRQKGIAVEIKKDGQIRYRRV